MTCRVYDGHRSAASACPAREPTAEGEGLLGGRTRCSRIKSYAGAPFSALWRQSIRLRPSNGLVRKPAAPALNAFVWLLSSGKAVMKMMGTDRPRAIRRFCSSIPLMPGILMSEIRQDVSLERG